MATSHAGREIQIDSEDGRFNAYVATPASGQGRGLLVLQEWWGLVPQIRDVCDRLARAGFVALAPDLYRGEATTDLWDLGSFPASGMPLAGPGDLYHSGPLSENLFLL